MHYIAYFFGGVRWRLLLKNAQGHNAKASSVLHCGTLLLLSGFVNLVTWFRLGDPYRAYAYAQDTGSSFSHTIGTVLAERILDVVVIFLLVAAAALILAASGVRTSWLFLGLGAFLLAGVIVVLLAMWFIQSHFAHFLPQSLRRGYHHLHQGTMGSFRQMPLVTFVSLLVWLSQVARLFLVAEALHFSLSVPLAIAATMTNAMLTLAPITPGGLGIVEPGVAGMLMLSLSKGAAVSIALLDRLINYISVIVTGAIILLVRETLKSHKGTR